MSRFHRTLSFGGPIRVHELSLCNAIAATVTDHAAGRPIRSVRLQIGAFRQVVPDTLRFCWSARTVDSVLAGSVLDIVEVPAVVECRTCAAATTLTEPLLVCASCGGREVELVSGEEFLIESIDVGEPAQEAV